MARALYCTETGLALSVCIHCVDVDALSAPWTGLFCAFHGGELAGSCCQCPPWPTAVPRTSSFSATDIYNSPFYCSFTGKRVVDCNHCHRHVGLGGRHDDAAFFCSTTAQLLHECNHCRVSVMAGFECADGANSDDLDCEDVSDVETCNQNNGSQVNTAVSAESESNMFAVVVDLLDEGLKNAEVVKELMSRFAVTRSVSWLEKFKRKHGLSKKRPELTLLEQSDDWIQDVKECVYKGYKAAELQYHLKIKWGVTIGRTRLWKILKVSEFVK
ncbi:hypothetical protein BDR26DRAFT_204260 [Obelidium mucronatum]|nr:hypothetical protein BDR26DRAFT_204260 [Obelidium mucronatum]